jgi:Tol biopolymer transport system component
LRSSIAAPARPNLRRLHFVLVLTLIASLVAVAKQAAAVDAVNGKIAYSARAHYSGEHDIFTMNEDGSEGVNLTNTPEIMESDPAWSADGSRIAFSSTDGSGNDIWVMNSDGSGQTRLTSDPGEEWGADWSPDGSKIIFVRDTPGDVITNQSDIWIMDADGSNQVNLTHADTEETTPAFSPDGTKIAMAAVRNGDLEIVTMDPNGENEQILTTEPSQYDWAPDWSPDGSMLVWMSQYNCCQPWEIYTMNADGSGQANLTNHPRDDDYPTWSPDGTKISFTSNRDGDTEVYTMPAPTPPQSAGFFAASGGTVRSSATATAPATQLTDNGTVTSSTWGVQHSGEETQLGLSKAGVGTVKSSSPGIVCGTKCDSDSASYPTGYEVALTATAARGHVFTGWTGACTGLGRCVLDMGADDLAATATFEACTITGTSGDDVLKGSAGSDVICGGDGNDTLVGRGSRDVLEGGSGDDTLAGRAGSDVLAGGSGNDTSDHSTSSSPIELTLPAPKGSTIATGEGTDGLVSIENAIGSSHADRIVGSYLRNVIDAGLGDDVVDGSYGLDTASYESAASGVEISLAVSTPQDSGHGSDTWTNMENVLGSSFDDQLTGSYLANTLLGGDGNDTIRARGGADRLFGEGGNDPLDGGAGWDMCSQGDGAASKRACEQ